MWYADLSPMNRNCVAIVWFLQREPGQRAPDETCIPMTSMFSRCGIDAAKLLVVSNKQNFAAQHGKWHLSLSRVTLLWSN
jgi:hypothetical protein